MRVYKGVTFQTMVRSLLDVVKKTTKVQLKENGMAGSTSVSLMSQTSVFEAFKELTVNRDHTKGALELETVNGEKRLSCVNHHFWQRSKNEGVSSGTQGAVREMLKAAVHGELDHFLDAALLAGQNTDELKEKIAGIKAAFDNAIKSQHENGSANDDVLLRKDIKKIVLNVSELKKNLTLDALRQMSAEQLANLSTDKSAKRQVERFKRADRFGTAEIGNSAKQLQLGHLNPSDVKLRNELRATLGTPQKFVADSLRKLHTAVHSGKLKDDLRAWQKQFLNTLAMRIGHRNQVEMKVPDWSGLADFIGYIVDRKIVSMSGCEEEDIAWGNTVLNLMKQVRDEIVKIDIDYPDMDPIIQMMNLDQ